VAVCSAVKIPVSFFEVLLCERTYLENLAKPKPLTPCPEQQAKQPSDVAGDGGNKI